MLDTITRSFFFYFKTLGFDKRGDPVTDLFLLLWAGLSSDVISKGLAPFTQLVKVRGGNLVLALPSIFDQKW